MIFVAGILVFILFNHWVSWNDGLILLQGQDVGVYLQMARAAPGLAPQLLGQHYYLRIFTPFLLGLLNRVTGIPIEMLYAFYWLLLVAFTLYFIWRMLEALLGNTPIAKLLWLSFLLNPYTCRFYSIVPGMSQDFLFITGASLFTWGFVSNQMIRTLAGSLVAVLGRQTAMVLIPGLLFSFFRSNRKLLSIFALVSISFTYLFLRLIVSPHSIPTDAYHFQGGWKWITSDQFRWIDLAEFFTRLAIPFLIASSLTLGLWWDCRKRPTQPFTFSTQTQVLLLFFAGAWAQPLIAGWYVTSKSAPRLTALGFSFFLALAATLIGELDQTQLAARVKKLFPIYFLGLALSSLHHFYSNIRLGNELTTLGIQMVVSIVFISAPRLCTVYTDRRLFQ